MSKKPIEQQIAELTPEQRNSMGKIFKKYIISFVSIVLICFLAVFGMLSEANLRERKAKERYDATQAIVDLYSKTNRYDASVYDENLEAIDEYYDIKQEKNINLIIIFTVFTIICVIVEVIFRKKYPYFSEKKYTYLKKLEKNSYSKKLETNSYQ